MALQRDGLPIFAALDWIGDVAVMHAEMRIENAFFELSNGGDGYRNPRQLGETSSALIVFVDDVDRHFESARASGARILAEPADKPWGLRQYSAEDPEGHRWEFSQHLRDVAPAEWGATMME